MKKVVLLALSGLAFTTASAQTEKGTTYWGTTLGNLRYSRTSQDNSNFAVSLYPTVGKFVTDKFLLGLTADLGYSRSKRGGYYASSLRLISYGAVPFARYYFAGADKHRFFGQLNAGLVWLTTKSEGSFGTGGTNTSRYGTAGAALGYNYFLTPGVALEATAGYNRNGINTQSFSGTFDIRAGLAIFLPSRQAAVVPAE